MTAFESHKYDPVGCKEHECSTCKHDPTDDKSIYCYDCDNNYCYYEEATN